MRNLNASKCPNCNQPLQLFPFIYLSNTSIVECKHCGAYLRPKKMSNNYFAFGFLITYISGIYFSRMYHSLIIGLEHGVVFGAIAYIISVFYAFFSVQFEVINY